MVGRGGLTSQFTCCRMTRVCHNVTWPRVSIAPVKMRRVCLIQRAKSAKKQTTRHSTPQTHASHNLSTSQTYRHRAGPRRPSNHSPSHAPPTGPSPPHSSLRWPPLLLPPAVACRHQGKGQGWFEWSVSSTSMTRIHTCAHQPSTHCLYLPLKPRPSRAAARRRRRRQSLPSALKRHPNHTIRCPLLPPPPPPFRAREVVVWAFFPVWSRKVERRVWMTR